MRQVNTQMLILAREARGLTQSELAKAVGVTQAKISKYENGMLLVSDDDLAGMAKTLNYSEELFFQSDKVYGLGSSILFHRQRRCVPIFIQRKLQANVNIMRMQIERLLRGAEVKDTFRFQELDIDACGGAAEGVADCVRAAWRLPIGPVPNLTAAIESAGGIVIKRSFETRRIDALHLWVSDLPPLFFVNHDLSGDRLRFTLAHEVGHAIMHSMPREKMEQEADQFAAELLMPREDIRKFLRNITLQGAALLKPHWKVSMAALIRRAKDLGEITERQYTRLCAGLSALGYRANEPIPVPVEEPTVLRELIAVHTGPLGYTDADLARLLFTLDMEIQWPDPDTVPVTPKLAMMRRVLKITPATRP
jgi:Zn-dependent peptidase ImmA (M78 family)/transcriptional regulator with XRE-family HTH domain